MPIVALLHPVAQLDWTRWSIHPSTVIGLAALGALYFWRAAQRGAGDAPVTLPRRIAFVGGLLAIFTSLNGPLHDLSDHYLFSAHMVQHLVLTLVMPPLLLAGLRGWMLRPLLDLPIVGSLARRVTRPIVCFATFNVVVAAWHLPPLYNAAVASHAVHIVQHLMFMTAAVLMWWPYLSPLPELPRLAYPGQMLYSFVMVIPMSIVSIYIAMADELLYPAYASAPRIWNIDPMMDQMVGGLIMWIPGGLFFYGVMTVVFFKWVGSGAGDDTASAQVNWKPARTN
ncbi:MAG TPA: cytochrome c oxidase assembly protein [Gemmatimonadaceae bacterium]|nr:cytochrome c oxidase assembly protein [Gemmatimonadaceae bacterium]